MSETARMSPAPDWAADDFTDTRWSRVRRLQGAGGDRAREALADLAVRYWYPAYAYVRNCGHPPEIAQDITRTFLQQVTSDLRSGRTEPPGRFRDWLLLRLDAFLAGHSDELSKGVDIAGAPPLADLESRNRRDHEAGVSPEQAYRRSFALEVLARGFSRLRAEARDTGHLDMCVALEPFLTREPLPGQYEELSYRIAIRPLAVMLALKRLRQRFRELVREELADTVSSAAEMATEQDALLAALDRRR